MPRMLKPPHLLYLENAPNTIKAQSRLGDSISKAAEGVDASQAITAGAHLRLDRPPRLSDVYPSL